MADSSLDDFFAKKDKSKKKSKSKMTPGDVLADKKDGGPKKVKKKKDTELPGGLGLNATEDTAAKKQAEDEDWVDYEVKKEVDYTGLRIQTLQIREDEDRDTAESDGDGEGGEGEDGQVSMSGPWNSATVAPAAPAPVVAPPPSEPPEKKEETGPKKYVPPAQRQAALNPISANPLGRRANKKAPNIQSEEDFPTLGGGMQTSSGSAWGGKRYEDSRAADIESNPGQRRGGNLSLENKYAALQE